MLLISICETLLSHTYSVEKYIYKLQNKSTQKMSIIVCIGKKSS